LLSYRKLLSIMSSINAKNLWCRDTLFQKMNVSKYTRTCSYGETCKGAHTNEEIIIFPNIRAWNNNDKSTYNFPYMYYNILNAIEKEKTKVNSTEFTSKINKISEMNFIEVLQLWRELATFYRKLIKDNKMLPKKSQWTSPQKPHYNACGYIFKDDIPYFALDEKIEEEAWSLERITKRCKIVVKNIETLNKKEPLTSKDICVGDKNCKEGYHYQNDALCTEDFLTGTCSCISKTLYETSLADLKTRIQEYEKNPKAKAALIEARNKYYSLYRKVHYTEQGMLSFDKQLEKYKLEKETEALKLKEEEDKKEKPSWDHKIDVKTPSKKVIKIKL